MNTISFESRFWKKVSKSDTCWIWTGNSAKAFNIGSGQIETAQRVAWLLNHGDWPEGKLIGTCSNRLCVRPQHHLEHMSQLPSVERFWTKIRKSSDPDGCWLWTAATTRAGYGVMNVDGKTANMHKFSWELHNGPVPTGMCVCHSCNIPSCVRPSHLFLGSHQANMEHMVESGRSTRGKRPDAKLNPEKAEDIRDRYDPDNGVTQQVLASEVGVSRSLIGKVLRQERWV